MVDTVDRDLSLPHQIVIFHHRGESGLLQLAVSCNCRINPSNRKTYEPMGFLTTRSTTEDRWNIYNDPTNHRNDVVKFNETWQRRPWERDAVSQKAASD